MYIDYKSLAKTNGSSAGPRRVFSVGITSFQAKSTHESSAKAS